MEPRVLTVMEERPYPKEELRELADKIVIKDDYEKIERVAGLDFTIIGDKIIAAVAVCNEKMEQIEKAYAVRSKDESISRHDITRDIFKEGTAMIEAVNKLEKKPDLLIVNGAGIIHPGLGLASYIGLILNIPTIGVSKNISHGKVIDGLVYVASEIKGYELATREGSRPVYVSPGHRVSLKSSIAIVKQCIKWPHKMPEPLALAHKYVNKVKKGLA